MNLLPTNAGEFWTAIGSLATTIAVIVALIPLFIHNRQQSRIKTVTVYSIITELINIHESYYGKIYDYIYKERKPIIYIIPESDYQYFEALERLQTGIIHLRTSEKEEYMAILLIFKRANYRRSKKGEGLLTIENIRDIEKLSNSLLRKFNKRTLNSVIKKIDEDKYRQGAYDRIIYIEKKENKIIPSYDEIKVELRD